MPRASYPSTCQFLARQDKARQPEVPSKSSPKTVRPKGGRGEEADRV